MFVIKIKDLLAGNFTSEPEEWDEEIEGDLCEVTAGTELISCEDLPRLQVREEWIEEDQKGAPIWWEAQVTSFIYAPPNWNVRISWKHHQVIPREYFEYMAEQEAKHYES